MLNIFGGFITGFNTAHYGLSPKCCVAGASLPRPQPLCAGSHIRVIFNWILTANT